MPPPTSFTQALADTICDYLAEGKSLRQIEKIEDMPSARTIYRWLAEPSSAAFRQQYAYAREAQADIMGKTCSTSPTMEATTL
jgi:transposase